MVRTPEREKLVAFSIPTAPTSTGRRAAPAPRPLPRWTIRSGRKCSSGRGASTTRASPLNQQLQARGNPRGDDARPDVLEDDDILEMVNAACPHHHYRRLPRGVLEAGVHQHRVHKTSPSEPAASWRSRSGRTIPSSGGCQHLLRSTARRRVPQRVERRYLGA